MAKLWEKNYRLAAILKSIGLLHQGVAHNMGNILLLLAYRGSCSVSRFSSSHSISRPSLRLAARASNEA